MTAEVLAGELPTGVILALCDRLLGEVGRRSHRFAWLRAPGNVADAWLPVDAYYPSHRLVVVCHADRAPYDHLFAQLVPQHGLRLLEVSPAELGNDADRAEQALRRMIARLPEPPGQAPVQDTRARRPARADASRRDPAQRPRAPRADPAERPGTPRLPSLPSLAKLEVARRPTPTPTPRPAPPPPRPGRAAVSAVRGPALTAGHAESLAVGMGVVAGLALAALCGAELILAVIAVALDSGRLVLGLGIAFDACARVLGTLVAGRAGKTGWAAASAIVGSPAVLAAAMTEPRSQPSRRPSAPGEVPIEATPLAAPIAALAIVCILIGLVA